MEHIEKMANLREDVAFEGYNQKQPLLVYQERAYEFFMKMLDEIHYRVVRGILGSNAATHVQQVEINIDDAIPMQADNSAHPLMRQSSQSDDNGIKVIRVK